VRLRFLGTGTSFGIPVIGCDCATCTSADPRDRRSRHGALLEDGSRRLLIDAPPELRLQLLEARVGSVDAVWITHCHADHIHGIDDLRAITTHERRRLELWAPPDCAHVMRTRFDYIFDDDQRPEAGTTKPELTLNDLPTSGSIDIAGFRMTPVPVTHGRQTPLGFRCGELGYVTDAKTIPPASLETLRGVRVLVLNALWRGHPHPTHLNVEEAIELARTIGAERTLLTHLTHRVRHATLAAGLPAGVEPAYDGLVIDIEG
jgi:phosphoribosyl 1,2-cyclic phosphate phosphodiesterase